MAPRFDGPFTIKKFTLPAICILEHDTTRRVRRGRRKGEDDARYRVGVEVTYTHRPFGARERDREQPRTVNGEYADGKSPVTGTGPRSNITRSRKKNRDFGEVG